VIDEELAFVPRLNGAIGARPIMLIVDRVRYRHAFKKANFVSRAKSAAVVAIAYSVDPNT
jgi:hypothetical protein